MNTTGNGVSEVVSEGSSELDETVTPPNEESSEKLSARDLKLMEMRQRVREEREADAGLTPEPEPVVAPPPAPVAAVTPPTGGPQIFEKDGKQFVRLTAYGQTEEIPLDVALRRAQKDVAADRKLQEATERERRAAAQEQMANDHLQRVRASASVPSVSDVKPAELDAQIKSALTKHYDGDIDTAASELAKLFAAGRQQATPVNADLIAAQVEQRLQRNAAAKTQAKYEAEVLNAVEVFKEEFPDIAQDTRLSAYFDRETELVMAENPGMSMNEVVRIAAKSIQSLSAPKAPPQVNTRLDAKRAAPKHITGVRSPSVSTHLEPPPKPVTSADIVARMRQVRGQAPR